MAYSDFSTVPLMKEGPRYLVAAVHTDGGDLLGEGSGLED